MCRLARERLPARDLGEMNQPLPALPQLIGHAVESIDRIAYLVSGRRSRIPSRFYTRRPVAGREVGQAFGELPDGLTDPMRDQDQRRQRNDPGRTEQQKQREREAAAKVASLDRFDELPRLSQLAG